MPTSGMVKEGMWEKSVLNLIGLETEAFGTHVLPTGNQVFSLNRM
jgi:hypothetical protein